MKAARACSVRLSLAIALSAVFLGSCASQGSHHEFKIKLGEFYFRPETIQVKVGEVVRLEFSNEGKLEHEVMIGHAVELKDGRPEHFEHDLLEGIDYEFRGEKARIEQEKEHGTMVVLQPGGRAILSFTLSAGKLGEWEIGCFLPGHYGAGMKGKLTVKL